MRREKIGKLLRLFNFVNAVFVRDEFIQFARQLAELCLQIRFVFRLDFAAFLDLLKAEMLVDFGGFFGFPLKIVGAVVKSESGLRYALKGLINFGFVGKTTSVFPARILKSISGSGSSP